MRLSKFILIVLMLCFVGLIIGCTQMTGQEQDVLIKITSRRIGYHGFKINPEMFTSLGELAGQSCQQAGERAEPMDVAFGVIWKTIAKQTKDPLLAQDLKDVAELIGVKFDAGFTLLGLTEDKLKFINIAICSFSKGVDAAKAGFK